jgi:predicted NBD/HSP70 family sugar kinase
MTLEPNGPLCNCGNHGCWETLVGPRAIVQRMRQAASEGRAPGLLVGLDDNIEALQLDHVLQAASDGVPAVIQALDEVGCYLGIGIANLINTLNPRMVVLGGILSLVGPYILPRARQEVNARAMAALREGVEIRQSAFKRDASVIGAVALILRQILNNPAVWYSRPSGPSIEDHLALSVSVL